MTASKKYLTLGAVFILIYILFSGDCKFFKNFHNKYTNHCYDWCIRKAIYAKEDKTMSEEWNDGVSPKIDDGTQKCTESVGEETQGRNGAEEEPEDIAQGSGAVTEPKETQNYSQEMEKPNEAHVCSQETEDPEEKKGTGSNPYAQYDTNRRQDHIWQNNPNGNANNSWQNHPNGNSYNNWQSNPNENRNNSWQNHGNNHNQKKKDSFGRMILKIVAVAAVFGLVAGGVFFGVNRLSNFISQDFSGKTTMDSADSGKNEKNDLDRKSTDDEESEEAVAILPGTGTTIKSTEVLTGEESDITDLSAIVEHVMPSIVAVSATIQQQTDYFGIYGGQTQTGTSSGSGVIYGEDGTDMYIVTNNHVIQGAMDVTVRFSDDSTAKAAVKGYDSDVDLAILSIKLEDLTEETKQTVRQVAIGDSDQIQVGEMVIAIGNALGYGQSMTVGYVSAKDRTVTTDTGVTMTLLQTDAAINPGNSGGALLNLKGELIGITNVKYATTSVEGMGFAIPISSATSIIKELEEVEVLQDDERGYLGVSCEDITSKQAEMYNMPAGVYITEVAKKGAADKAGIVRGDIITAVNGTKVETRSALQNRITSKRIGTTVTITYMRSEGGKYVEHEAEAVLQGYDSLGDLGENEDAKENQQDNQGKSDDGVDYGDYYDEYNDFYNDFFKDFFYY